MRRGLADTRAGARVLVEHGRVLVSGSVADKAARLVAEAEPVEVRTDTAPRFVSRGGEKLDAALRAFAVTVHGRRCLDAGASTGGFTDCLLRGGASEVVAVDVGYGQLHPTVRADARVVVMERTNVRALESLDLKGGFEVVVADLSFISLTVVAPVLAGALAVPGADLVVLVKPQFEVGRIEASRGRGVIRRPEERRAALLAVASAFASQGASIMGAVPSPVLGPAGNAEFFLHARAHGGPGGATALPGPAVERIEAAVAAAPDAGKR